MDTGKCRTESLKVGSRLVTRDFNPVRLAKSPGEHGRNIKQPKVTQPCRYLHLRRREKIIPEGI